jgi:hypothetical protein
MSVSCIVAALGVYVLQLKADIRGCSPQAKVTLGEPARSVAYNHDGSHLAVGTTKGSIRVLLGSDMTKLLAYVSSLSLVLSVMPLASKSTATWAGQSCTSAYPAPHVPCCYCCHTLT